MRYKDEILAVINNTNEHVSAEEIFFKLKNKHSAVAMATVYNNLNSLHQEGAIRKISIEGQPDRYDRNTIHDHLVCAKCGKLSDIFMSDLTASLESQLGFHIQGYDLRVKYLCPDCKKKYEKFTDK